MPAISKKNKETVAALRKLFSNTYKPAEGRDALCYRYKVLSMHWGKDVVSQPFFAGVNFYTPETLVTYLGTYHRLEKAFYGEMAGEKQ